MLWQHLLWADPEAGTKRVARAQHCDSRAMRVQRTTHQIIDVPMR